ncbi:MAG TPA: hypothetical protein VGJ14_18290 [Sporichthyaceae bacterium]|jgi:hypothetical protein
MTTATIDAAAESTARRNPGQRPRPAGTAAPSLVEVRKHTEVAVSDFVSATSDAFRAFLPAAVTRPTEAVEYAFDLAEQMLAGARRVFLELAAMVEHGMEGAQNRRAA